MHLSDSADKSSSTQLSDTLRFASAGLKTNDGDALGLIGVAQVRVSSDATPIRGAPVILLTSTMTKSSQHHALVKYFWKPKASHLSNISKKKITVNVLSMTFSMLISH